MTNPHDIIIKPIVTEQSMAAMAENKNTFVVSKSANKTEISFTSDSHKSYCSTILYTLSTLNDCNN